MKRLILNLTLVLMASNLVLKSQTNVSGGIFSNTVWTKANSPYIVVDTVVVFPGVTLTIQPGVTIKFANNKRIELRQAKMLAVGSTTDPIVFTSNSASPAMGSWAGIYINTTSTSTLTHKFSHCRFFYADNAIIKDYGDSVKIKNSYFSFNNSGVGNKTHLYLSNIVIDSSSFVNNGCGVGSFYTNPYGTRILFSKVSNSRFSKNQQAGMVIGYTSITNCTITANQNGSFENQGSNIYNKCYVDSNSASGIYAFESDNDQITDCRFRYNGVGIFDDTNFAYQKNTITRNIIEFNTIGIKSTHPQDSIFCNKICSNTSYGFYNNSTSNVNVKNNYWCTPDSASTQALIYDARVNTNVGLVTFMPRDLVQCYLGASVMLPEHNAPCLLIYPNPMHNEVQFRLTNSEKPQRYLLLNNIGEIVAQGNVGGTAVIVSTADLAAGIYYLKLENVASGVVKLIKE